MLVWEDSKQNIILPNNGKLLAILENIKQYSSEEKMVVDAMKNHIEAFRTHCENPLFDYTDHQFPMSFSDLIYQYCAGNQNPRAMEYGNWVKSQASTKSIPNIARKLRV